MPADVAEAAQLLFQLSKPWADGEQKNSALVRASKLAGLKYWRAFDIWYRKARRIEDHEIEQIKTALRNKRESAARNELHDLKMRLTRLEALLRTNDPDFHRLDIDYAREASHGPRGNQSGPMAPKGNRR